MDHPPGLTEEAVSGRSASSQGEGSRPADPQTPPPAVDPRDPIAPATHVEGGTYAKADFSPAARRSEVHTDQFDSQPGPAGDRETQSGFDGADGLEGPATLGGGH